MALYPLADLAKDIGCEAVAESPKLGGITLAHNVRNKEEVDQILKKAEAAGAKIVKAAHETFWGGYAGYFADPDGHLWEVAWGAFPFNDDGSLDIP